ncbi:MAG: NYN domain-containing protein [Phycisphaerales bacterium]|nr:MAG: NYN domain-containing protein [Phycisphaerales bacterium]
MLIIDGHNLLHAIAKIEESPRALGELALCRILGTYLKLSGEKAEIIFDGTGPPDKSGFDATSNLEVLFAGLGTDADSVIEDKIKASTAPKGLTIVSSDRRLKQAARTRRATAVKSDVFWTQLQKQLSRKRKPQEPAAKRQGLSQSETEQWLDVFGLGQ